MGSYAQCWLGSFYVGSTKEDIDPGLMGLFRSSDKAIVRGKKHQLPFQMRCWANDVDGEEEVFVTFYRAPVPIVRDRLELRGYTFEVAKSAFSRSLQAEAAQYRELAASNHGELFEPLARILETADVDKWLAALSTIRSKGLEPRRIGGDSEEYKGTLIGYMLDHDWYGYSGPDLNIGLRLVMDACSDSDEFIYDVTDLILGECLSSDEDLVERALWLSSSEYSSSGRVIVLTEGCSDSRVIADSLQLLYPHLFDYFTFMDFDNARVGGGAGNLANVVKTFAGAGIVNRVIALFDNDTAAAAALQSLRVVRLPKNIRILRLPELPALRAYPTIGPSGTVVMDVNGIAASIELYFGVDVLSEGGELTPVQWTGYEASLRKYQGEVLSKDRIHDRFERRLEACRENPRLLNKTDWDGIRAILKEIFAAFQEIDRENIRAALDGYYAR